MTVKRMLAPVTISLILLSGCVRATAIVEGLTVELTDTLPAQVDVGVKGHLKDSCEELGRVTQSYDSASSTFSLNVSVTRDPGRDCLAAARPFEKSVRLEDTYGLPKGTYTVRANDVSATFELGESNFFLANVRDIAIEPTGTKSEKVDVLVRGAFRDGCEGMGEMTQSFDVEARTFTAVLKTFQDHFQDCPTAERPFEEHVLLEGSENLPRGNYRIRVNDMMTTFSYPEGTTDLAEVQEVTTSQVGTNGWIVMAHFRGAFNNGCGRLGTISQLYSPEKKTFVVTVGRIDYVALPCTEALVPFEWDVTLDGTSGLRPGTYTVEVNGVSATFELTEDNGPVPAP